MQQYISAPYMFSSQALTEVANCGIMHHNGAHAGPDKVNCGGSCSHLLLLHPSPTCACAVSFYQLVQIYILYSFSHVRIQLN